MSTHVTVSHGSDFLGVDILPVHQLREFGKHVRGVLPAADYPPLTTLLDAAGQGEHAIDSDQAALLAILLRRAAAHRRLKKPFPEIATRLGIAAANAAADPAPWTWTPTTEGSSR
ncbi:DUF7739 domain-containing protein [Streptomyces acidiscabies]|uniref:DUF7739 domain-containing protein n=1 Tax=Streptomyces acidiscabies TaxID=42234 RepID=A0AAP6BL25_9ACTN|nr:hypothetical protein [Streptomyces acidiscabies]MBZ3918130.1 hypothetical protein [Streptomyces acidiscabies]MDX2966472.1 hypothetical protein [Streptomyces acidiscabies]MDX3796418.1 hypothetical protein [Streptomyces acidiscabies]